MDTVAHVKHQHGIAFTNMTTPEAANKGYIHPAAELPKYEVVTTTAADR